MTVTKNAWTNVCGLCEHTHTSRTSDTGNSLMWVPRRHQGGLFWIAQYPHWAATWGFLKIPLLCCRTLRALPRPLSQKLLIVCWVLNGTQWQRMSAPSGSRTESRRILGMVHECASLTRCCVGLSCCLFLFSPWTPCESVPSLVSACENQVPRYFDS